MLLSGYRAIGGIAITLLQIAAEWVTKLRAVMRQLPQPQV